MKIAMIGQKGIPATYGGVERHVEELAAALVERGHQVTVYSRPHYSPAPPAEHRGIGNVVLPSIPTKHLDAVTHCLLASLDTLRRDCDLVHYHAIGPAAFCGIPRLVGKRTVVTVHALDWLREKWGRPARLALRAGAGATRMAGAVIAVSHALEREMRRRYGVRATCIPNGVEPVISVPLQLLRKRLGLEERRFVLFMGRFVPEKGCHLLIEAWRKLSTRMHLVMAGDLASGGSYLEELRELAEGDERIVFPSGLYGREKAEALSHAAAFVLPSLLEGMPICLLEALSHGCPALASDIPENLEVLDAEGQSLAPTFRSGDAHDLADGLRRILREQMAARARGARAAAHIARTYDWRLIAERTEEVYLRA